MEKTAAHLKPEDPENRSTGRAVPTAEGNDDPGQPCSKKMFKRGNEKEGRGEAFPYKRETEELKPEYPCGHGRVWPEDPAAGETPHGSRTRPRGWGRPRCWEKRQ